MSFFDPLWKEDCPLDGIQNPWSLAHWLRTPFGITLSDMFGEGWVKLWQCDTYGACFLQGTGCYAGRGPATSPDPATLSPVLQGRAQTSLLSLLV